MKKTTLKITTFLLLTMFALHVQGQIDFTKTYNLKNIATGKYLYIADSSSDQLTLVDKAGNENLGLNFTFNDRSGGVVNIASSVRGIFRGAGSGASYRVNATTFAVTAGQAADNDKIWVATQVSGANYRFSSGSRAMYYNAAGVGTNLEITTTTTSDDNSLWTLEESSIVLSNEDFDISSIFVSNPVKNEITIKGLTGNVKQISLYSILGKEVSTKKLDKQTSLSIDISDLASGLYLLEMKGENGAFTKKVIKQ